MPVLIASGANITNSTYGTRDDYRQCFVMSDDRRLVIYGSGTLSYKTSADGVTWSSANTITGTNGAGQHVAAVVQVGDTIYLWQIGASGNIVQCIYSTGTNLLTASTPSLATGVFYNLQHATSLVVGWDGTNSRFYAAAVLSSVVVLFEVASSLTAYTGSASGATAFGASAAVYDIAVLPAAAQVIYTTSAGLWVFPATYSGGVFLTGSPELVIAGTIPGAACALDASNKLDVVWMDSSGNIVTRKRTGSAVYNSQQSVGFSGDTSYPSISLTTDGADLVALYTSLTGQANGEVYLAKRKSGTWSLGLLFTGGDASGYHTAKSAAATTSSRADILYQQGSDVYYSFASTGSAPDAPVITAPSGYVTSTTPTITAPYVNSSAPNDPQGAFEDQVLDGLTVMWDSGEVAGSATSNVYGTNSNTGDPNYVAPSSLVDGTPYTSIRRYKDTLLLPAQWSGWSSPVTFTPILGGTVTITNLSDGGVAASSSPVSLGSPAFDSITASWSSPTSNGADQYQDVIYAADDVTVVAQTTVTTIAGGLASGASYTSAPWSPSGLANSTTYQLARRYRDTVTLLWAESAHWELDTSWVPPDPPTGFTVVMHPEGGTAVCTWTNPGTAVTVLLERAGGETWTTLYSGSLITTRTDYPPLLSDLDYRVSIFNALGIQSDYAAVSDTTLEPNGVFGVWLHDTTAPTIAMACFGIIVGGDWQKASMFVQPDDLLKYVPLGSDLPIISRRRQNYVEATQREYLIPPTDSLGWDGAVVDQQQTEAMLVALKNAGNPCLYRDVRGKSFFVRVANVSDAIAQGEGSPVDWIQFDITEVAGPGVPLTS